MRLWVPVFLLLLGFVSERVGLGPFSLLLLLPSALYLGVYAGLVATARAVGLKKPEMRVEGPWRVIRLRVGRKTLWRVTAYLRVWGPRVTPDELDLVTGWGRIKSVLEMLRAGTDYVFLLKRDGGETKFYLGASAEGEDAGQLARRVELALRSAKRAFEDLGCRVEIVGGEEVEPPLARREKREWWHLAVLAAACIFIVSRVKLGFSFSWFSMSAGAVAALIVALAETLGSEFYEASSVRAAAPNPAPQMSKVEALTSLSFAYEAFNWHEGDYYLKIIFRRADEEVAKLRSEYAQKKRASLAADLPELSLASERLLGLIYRIEHGQERLFRAAGVVVGEESVDPILRALGWEPKPEVPPHALKLVLWA